MDGLDLVALGPITLSSTLRSCPYLEKHVPWDSIQVALQDVVKVVVQKKLSQLMQDVALQWLCRDDAHLSTRSS